MASGSLCCPPMRMRKAESGLESLGKPFGHHGAPERSQDPGVPGPYWESSVSGLPLSVPLLNHTVLFWYQHTQRDALRKRSGSLALLLIVGIWGSSRSGTKGTLTLPFLEQPEETVPSGFSARRSCATSGPLVGF